jgi:hypothetical protein
VTQTHTAVSITIFLVLSVVFESQLGPHHVVAQLKAHPGEKLLRGQIGVCDVHVRLHGSGINGVFRSALLHRLDHGNAGQPLPTVVLFNVNRGRLRDQRTV